MGVELAADSTGCEMDNVDFSDSEVVHHVRNALKLVPLGDTNSYNELIGVIHHKQRLAPDDVALLVTSLKALSGAVSYIDFSHHESLLYSIFGMSMWNYGPDVMDALVELVICLGSSKGVYLDLCLDMLVSNFIPPYSFLELLKQPRGLAKKNQVLSRVHSALKTIATLVPLSSDRLGKIITEKMPNVYSKELLIVTYVENMLMLEGGAIGEYIGSLMIKAVVDRLLDLDVEIGWDDILHDGANKGIFEMELEDIGDIADDAETNFLFESSVWKKLGGNLFAEKLDSVMVLTFEYLSSCAANGRLTKVFEILLESFQMTVLNAYKSKFTQFVMFYACSVSPEECGFTFAVLLADIFVCNGNTAHSQLTRMSAVAYLASYLSRGKFLPASFVASMLRRLVDWCWIYCQIEHREINPKAHRVFYSGCQAIMYALCFRMKSMLEVPRLKSELNLMHIQNILEHQLNPLEVCLPSVVQEFLKQAKAAGVFTVSDEFVFNDLLESDFSREFGGIERLDMFFPFDPCLLRKCDRFIRPNFVYWSMVSPTYDDDNEDCSDDDVAEGFEGRDFGMDEFDCSLNKMSITPKTFPSYCFGEESEVPMQMPSRIRPSTSPESL